MKILVILLFLLFNKLFACDAYVLEDNGDLKVFTSGDPIDCDNGSKKFILEQKIIYCDNNKNKKSIQKVCKKSINEYEELLNKKDEKNWIQKIFG